MLARLDGIDGVVESRVEATGRVFLLALAEGADEGAVLAAATEAFRGAPRRLDGDAAAAQLAARAAGDPWFSRAEVPALCYLESRLVASRGADAVAAAAGLSREEREKLDDVLRDVLFAITACVLAEGGRESSGWFNREWPALSAAAADRSAAFVAPERLARVRAALARLHPRP